MKFQSLLSILFFVVVAFGNTSIAQSNSIADLGRINNSISGVLIMEVANIATSAYENETAKYAPFILDEAIYKVNVSKSFGSYVVPNTNYLKIVASDGKNYNRAQLINKETGEALFSIRLLGSKNTVDMSGTTPGVYKLILTNTKNDLYTEDIMIM